MDRILLASGKLVWDLEEERRKREDDRTAILRVEQLYPAPGAQLAALTRRYPEAELVGDRALPTGVPALTGLGTAAARLFAERTP